MLFFLLSQGPYIYNKKSSKQNLWLGTNPTIQTSLSSVCIRWIWCIPRDFFCPIWPFSANIASASTSSSRSPSAHNSWGQVRYKFCFYICPGYRFSSKDVLIRIVTTDVSKATKCIHKPRENGYILNHALSPKHFTLELFRAIYFICLFIYFLK